MIGDTVTGSDDRAALPRIRTGSAELDFILGGGFPASSINIVMGEPGSGKTLLVERLVFENAHGGRPILYLTTLSEPLEKMVRYLQQFPFFEEEKLTSGAIVYDSLGEALQEGGVGALVPKLRDVIKTLAPSIIVIDSFKAIHDISTSGQEMRRMLHEMAGLLTAYDTTAFLVGEYSERMISSLPEFAVADSMVELAREKEGTRDARYLRVLKLRGSSYLEGLHAFRITRDGLEVYPRLTSPDVPPAYIDMDDRISTGSPGIDRALSGGVWAGCSVLVEGPTGSGKTTLALQFVLEGLKRGEPVLYLNFQENPTMLARTIRGLGWELEDAKARGLHLIYSSPVELQIDSILVQLFSLLEAKGIRRVAIDAVGDLVTSSSDSRRALGYMYALSQHFQVRRVSSIMTLETVSVTDGPLVGQISALSDSIWRLAYERDADRGRRTFQVVKARGTEHDLDIRELRITSRGADVI